MAVNRPRSRGRILASLRDMTNRRPKSMPQPVLTRVSQGNWRFDVRFADGEEFSKSGFQTRSSALDAACDRIEARQWQRLSERKAAAGRRGGTKSHPKQPQGETWAKRTRELMNSGESFAEAAEIAAEETGFKLASNYKTQHNQFRNAEHVPTPPETPLEKSRRIRADMDRIKRLRDEWLST